MQIQGSAQDFDNWSELTTLMVFAHDDANFANLIGKTNYAGWMDNSRNTAWAIFTHRLDGGYKERMKNYTAKRLTNMSEQKRKAAEDKRDKLTEAYQFLKKCVDEES